jgi:hypothetical protein
MEPSEVFSTMMTCTLRYREVLQHILAQADEPPGATEEAKAKVQSDIDRITAAVDQVYATGEAANDEAEPEVDPLMPNSGGIYQNPPTPAS